MLISSVCRTLSVCRVRSFPCAVLALIFLCGLSAGCTPKKIITGPTSSTIPVTAPKVQSAVDQAAAAWAAGNMMEAERLYSLTLQDTATPPALRAQAWERLTGAAIANNHMHSALEVLEAWRVQMPGADANPIWLTMWMRAAEQLQPGDAMRRADVMWRDPLRPVPVRFATARKALPQGDPALLGALQSMYDQSDAGNRALMERDLLAVLMPLPEPMFNQLISQPGTDQQFPWSVLLLEATRRVAAAVPAEPVPPAPAVSGEGGVESGEPVAPSPMAALLAELTARLGGVTFADPTLPAVVGIGQQPAVTGQPSLSGPPVPAALPVPPVSALVSGPVSYQSVCTALLLPLSGPYASLGKAVGVGATTAQRQLGQAGVNVDVRLVDTEQPDWVQQAAQLPPQCVAVGGPLRPDSYRQGKEQGVLNGRALFAFLPRLDEGDEGNTAWRFFAGRDDQLETMVHFAGQLGIRDFGVFYPEDAFGNAMVNEFSTVAQRNGGTVSRTLSYPPEELQQWTKLAGQFVGVRMMNKVPVPSSSFHAVLLPDSWKNMDMVVSTLFYQGEDSQVLMGTSLWEQALLDSPPAVLTNMDLLVFPGAWNKYSASVPARLLQAGLSAGQRADTWAALGYDFVRFAAALGLSEPGAAAAGVNQRIEQAQSMPWAMAPLRWQGGRVTQDLFVLTPSADAPLLVDPLLFQQKLEKARAKSERRAARASGRKK